MFFPEGFPASFLAKSVDQLIYFNYNNYILVNPLPGVETNDYWVAWLAVTLRDLLLET